MRILAEILDIFFMLYLLTFIGRFTLQAVRAGFNNQLAQLFITVTNPLVLPARRVIPGFRGLDIATLVMAAVVAAVNGALFALLYIKMLPPSALGLALYVVLRLVTVTLDLFIFCIIIRVLISWIAPYQHNPMAAPLFAISEVILAPVRRIIPPISGIDLSPLFVMILIFIVRRYSSVYATGFLLSG